jgi:hypothetical protein
LSGQACEPSGPAISTRIFLANTISPWL